MSGADDPVFSACFEITVGIEGGLTNDPNDPGIKGQANPTLWKATTYNLNVWAELHNPSKTTAATALTPYGGGKATLTVGNTAVPAYQLLLCQTPAGVGAVPDKSLLAPGMVTLDPTGDPARNPNLPATNTTW